MLMDFESHHILVNMLISAEDHRFRFHLGFDLFAIGRAIRNNIFYKKNEGASTIEQQLVRTLTGDYRKKIMRKVKEITFAFLLKTLVDKKTIALIYLRVAYYGTDLNNLDSIKNKFGKRQNEFLNEDLAAEIVARLKYPEPRPTAEKKIQLIAKRKQYILRLYYKHSKNKIFLYHV